MAWIPRGQDGLVQQHSNGETSYVPALTTHHGELWCLWSSPSGNLYFAIGDNDSFGERQLFPDRGNPVVAELFGTLHAVIVRNSGEIAHWVYDDIEGTWGEPTVLDQQVGLSTSQTPALIAFHNKLFLVFVLNESLFYSSYVVTPNDEPAWTSPQEVSGISTVSGIPALFVMNDTLHVLCGSSAEDKEILGFAYSLAEDLWNSCADVSEGKAVYGVSATSYGNSAFLAFQEGPDGSHNAIYVSEYKDGKWLPQEPIADQVSADPPQLSILNGRINCIFNANNASKELQWYSRSLLDFDLSSWMKNIPDDTLLSNITVPGTHDSCARSKIPFVRTQYLSIGKQMDAGLRFLDLRVRVLADGQLYMYHGGIPIDLPFYLKFDYVMNEVFDLFKQNPSETVLISINNDNVAEGKENPTIFYKAIKRHIDEHADQWITSPTTVTLGEARGKAVLIRRYQADPAIPVSERIGLDLSGWLNNNPDFTLITPTNTVVHLQDKWQYSDVIPLASLISSKFSYVSNLLKKAQESPEHEWHVNFMSAVGDPVEKGEVAESHWIAVGAHSHVIGKFVQGMNPTVRRGFEWQTKGRYGIIAMDYPELPKDSDLVALLVGTNLG